MQHIRKNILSALFCLLVTGSGWGQVQLYVSTHGSDRYQGTVDKPFKSVAMALRACRQPSYSGKDVVIDIRNGTYYLDTTLVVDAQRLHLGSLVLRAYEGEKVFISAGQKLNLEWKPYKNGIYQAIVPKNSSFERLYVNGALQQLARYPNYDANVRVFHGYAKDAISPARVKTWKNPAGAYVHALHVNEWGSVHYKAISVDKEGELKLEGGWQNSRGGKMNPEYRFVENVFEELDTASEWYLDKNKGVLYYYPPKGLDLHKAIVEASRLKNSIVLKGTGKHPLKNVRVEYLNFLHNERSFMDTKETLLRSDWTIYRGGAILLDGTEDCKITRCSFQNIGGNAVFLSDYNKRDTISTCLIDHIGASAVIFAGNPDAVRSPIFTYDGYIPYAKLDKTPGPKSDDYPQNCVVTDNLIHDIGVIEKQVAGVDIDMSTDITVSHNSIYNTPRAGINIGSGCWGGNILEYNDVFHTVLETGDNGAFNSWGRDRFWNADRKYMDSLAAIHPELILLDVQKSNIIHDNRFQCDHGWDIDLDDGSSNYHIYNNVCLSGGLKLREGFYRTVENNIIINNSFHPHVWFKNSGDVFEHNIVMKKYFPIGINYWGKLIDSNLLLNEADRAISKKNGTDAHSLYGDPEFVDPATGNYTVKASSPALKIGFKNFSMTEFGVQDPALNALASHPSFPLLQTDKGEDTGHREISLLGGKLKSVEGLGDRSAYGLPSEEGIIIISVERNSMLAKSGLQAKDVILAAGGKNTKNAKSLIDVIHSSSWKAKIPVEIMRDQRRIKTSLYLK